MPFINRISSRALTPDASTAGASPGLTTVSPALWYKNENLPGSFGNWPNSGTLGSNYALYGYQGNPSITSISGVTAASFSSGTNLYWSPAGDLTIHQSSQYTPFGLFVVSRVDSGGYLGFLGSWNLPSSRPNGIGPYSQPTHYEWYDNDGGPYSSSNHSGSNTLTQYAYVHTTNGSIRWYEGKSSSYYYNTTGAYGANLTVRGITGIRSTWPSGYVCELILVQGDMSDAQITEVRNYLGAKFSGAGRVNT